MEFGIGNEECGRLKLGGGEAMKLGSCEVGKLGSWEVVSRGGGGSEDAGELQDVRMGNNERFEVGRVRGWEAMKLKSCEAGKRDISAKLFLCRGSVEGLLKKIEHRTSNVQHPPAMHSGLS